MKARVIAGAVLLLAWAGAASGETVVTGNINSDTVWHAEASPYIVVGPPSGTVTVKSPWALTIEAGVEVRFEDGRSLETENGSSIVAVGAPGDSIVFTSDSETPFVGIWDSVHAFSSPASRFERCVFRHAARGIYVNACSPEITMCSFEGCETGIYCQQGSPAIEGCSITGSTFAGILCWGQTSEPAIHHSRLEGNVGHNVRLANYTETLVTIDAEFNWWGSANPAEIAATIYDNADDTSVYGVVDYDPWLATPVEEGSWGRIKALFIE